MIPLLLGLLSAQAGTLVDGVACVVNDEVITFSEVYDTGGTFVSQKCGLLQPGVGTPCTDAAEREVVESLIMQLLVKQKLSEVGMDVPDQDLDRTIDQIMRDNNIETREEFRAALQSQGYSWDVYREQLRDQVRMMRFRETFLRPQVRISEDEIRDAYSRAARQEPGEDQLQITYAVYPIPGGDDVAVLEFKVTLVEQVAAIRAGEASFDALGPLGDVEPTRASDTYLPSQMVDELRPILELEPGQTGGPYRIGGSYFIVRLDGIKPGKMPTFEESKANVENQLYEKRLTEEAEQWYQHARRSAAIRCTVDGPAGPE